MYRKIITELSNVLSENVILFNVLLPLGKTATFKSHLSPQLLSTAGVALIILRAVWGKKDHLF